MLTRRPLVSSTRVCTPTGVPDCRGPCDGCEDYCEQVSQSWCDLSHSISTLVSEKTECDFNNDKGLSTVMCRAVSWEFIFSYNKPYDKVLGAYKAYKAYKACKSMQMQKGV